MSTRYAPPLGPPSLGPPQLGSAPSTVECASTPSVAVPGVNVDDVVDQADPVGVSKAALA